jgi:hypothetical protein
MGEDPRSRNWGTVMMEMLSKLSSCSRCLSPVHQFIRAPLLYLGEPAHLGQKGFREGRVFDAWHRYVIFL